MKYQAKDHLSGSFSSKGFQSLITFIEDLDIQFMLKFYEKRLLKNNRILKENDANDWIAAGQ